MAKINLKIASFLRECKVYTEFLIEKKLVEIVADVNLMLKVKQLYLRMYPVLALANTYAGEVMR